MSGDGGGHYHAVALEVERRRLEHFDQRLLEALRRLVNGDGGAVLTPKSLPPRVLIDQGDWSAGARYRPGDLVASGGVAYVAVAPSGGALASVEPPDIAFWRPLGSTATPPTGELIFWAGSPLVGPDGEGLYWG